MSDPYAPPRTRLAEAPLEELNWASFTQLRRIAIFLNAMTAALVALLAGLLAAYDRGNDPFSVTLVLLYAGATGFSALVLWPWRGIAPLRVLAVLLGALLFLIGAGVLVVLGLEVSPRRLAAQPTYLAFPVGLLLFLVLPAGTALAVHLRVLFQGRARARAQASAQASAQGQVQGQP